MLRIPCGVCSECIRYKQLGYVQRFIMESQYNHVFMASLTYNNDMLPVYTCTNGHQLRYADYDDLNSVIRRLRNHNMFSRSFRYFAVSELGSKRGRPHFHICFFLPKFKGDTFEDCLRMESEMFNTLKDCWARNVGLSKKYPVWKPLFTYKRIITRHGVRSNYDLHYINPRFSANGAEDVGWYVLKYMLKPSDRAKRLQQALRLNLDPAEYNEVWNIVKPRIFKSLDFGLSKIPQVSAYLHQNVDKFIDNLSYPTFVSPTDGKVFPLSRFYRSKGNIYSFDMAKRFYELYPPDEVEYDVKHISEEDRIISDFERVKKQTDYDVFEEDESLFN